VVSAQKQPPYDLLVFGATSFVGQILTQYLYDAHGVGGDVSWAIAGRSQLKLETLKSQLGSGAANLPLLVADATDDPTLQALCMRTRVIISTVGPYALYGEPLIKACVETGTDYCDLAGEVQWIGTMVSRYEAVAKESGARIVHGCGFDSIPSDMGVWFLQQQSQNAFSSVCQDVRMRLKAAKGTLSGGTVASMINIAKEMAADPELRRSMANPFSISPAGHRSKTRQPSLKGPGFDKTLNSWLAPFVMSAINTRIVHRSNALQNARYGQEFTYDEAVMTGRGVKGRLAAYGITAALAGFFMGSAVKPTRWIIEKFVPQPGQGPSPEAQQAGFFDIRFVGKTADGRAIITRVKSDRDPGYGATSRMLGEAATCLAFDTPKNRDGGFWTPASLLGQSLLARLTSRAGLSFDVLETR